MKSQDSRSATQHTHHWEISLATRSAEDGIPTQSVGTSVKLVREKKILVGQIVDVFIDTGSSVQSAEETASPKRQRLVGR